MTESMPGINVPKTGVARITYAKKWPDKFPLTYSAMKFKKHRGEWVGVLFTLDTRIYIDFKKYWEMIKEARDKAMQEC